jgi:hypothetical protein
VYLWLKPLSLKPLSLKLRSFQLLAQLRAVALQEAHAHLRDCFSVAKVSPVHELRGADLAQVLLDH